MKGFVPTPPAVVDQMVSLLFDGRQPDASARVLDPGCGRGAFIDGVIRWSRAHGRQTPMITGIESDPCHASHTASRFADEPTIDIRQADFLRSGPEQYDYVIGNPPYVSIAALTPAERDEYRRGYETAVGRFDLYLLFFEQALSMLKPGGRLVFVTPEKFLYVNAARPLRRLLRDLDVEEIRFLDEDTFEGLVTYPLVTTLSMRDSTRATRVLHRDHRTSTVDFAGSDASWLPAILGHAPGHEGSVLGDICRRISCGVATGADAMYTLRDGDLDDGLRGFAYPTVAGRQLRRNSGLRTTHSMLLPYAPDGQLLDELALGALGTYLREPRRRERLLARSCTVRKPWYAFHETPPMTDLLRPKLLCKDITDAPFFVVDHAGSVIPRHSVYYIVPHDPAMLDELASYLNSATARRWLELNCQRAAKGFLRLQSQVLRHLPLPDSLAGCEAAEGADAMPDLALV
jgi:SAM-dependent methyltransferase